jgi:ribosomal protein S18 acetylase RimI-like enzyme
VTPLPTPRGGGSPAGTVRPALPIDAPRIGALQAQTWRAAYGAFLPAEVLAEVDAEAERAWTIAVERPPSMRHHVLVAVEPENAEQANDGTGPVVGFVALAPATDDDAEPSDSEIAVLVVSPDHQRVGHGSRLLTAAVDTLRAEGCTRALAWVLAQDDALRGLLTSSGWATDGSHRTLETDDGSAPVRQVRLHTDLRGD